MKRYLLAATSAIGAVIASPAIAQNVPQTTQTQPSTAADAQTDDGQIQDIVVTAQRRNERAQDVPIAITAFTADDLQARGITSALEIGQYVPNMTALNNVGAGSSNAYYIRGLGNTESIPTFDPPVGTYVDDIYLSRQNANNLNLFDVERVEVLRGPQGHAVRKEHDRRGRQCNIAQARQGSGRFCRGRVRQF